MKPVRISLSRRAGFDLQARSRKLNGLDAVKVTRPGKFGNPFSILPNWPAGKQIPGSPYFAVPTREDAIECYRLMIMQRPNLIEAARRELAGKNLACWCRVGLSCHADVLLEIANGAGDNVDNPGEALPQPAVESERPARKF